MIDETLIAVSGKKGTQEKQKLIHTLLGVWVSTTEIRENNGNNNLLKEIIAARMPRICPQCKGKCFNEKNTLSFCDYCQGKGEVTGVEFEKFQIKRIFQAQ
ncbi:MAG: hypothetical protein Q7R92_05545 [bacterium]|nr:hypothetical protein [bacterium]